MITRRFAETLAMLTIGDSVLCMISPRRHTLLWLSGPPWWRRMCEPFVRYPSLTRAMGTLGLGFGIWLAWRQEPRVSNVRAEIHSAPNGWANRLMEAAR